MTSAPKRQVVSPEHGHDQAADHADHHDQQRPDPQGPARGRFLLSPTRRTHCPPARCPRAVRLVPPHW
jgi:hypothetical protein